MTKRAPSLLRFFPVAIVAAGLAACVPPEPTGPKMEPPRSRPERPTAPEVAPTPDTPKSAAARAYFAEVQRGLLAQGLLRTDGGGEDTPYGRRQVVENFSRIALHDEYSRKDGGFVRGETASMLRRWEVPVRVNLVFGPSVSAERQATDRARVASYLERLGKVTGHSISLVTTGGNFTVHVVSEDEREALGPSLSRQLPGLTSKDISDVTAMPRTTYCMVYALSEGNTGAYTQAVAVVRAEHPDLLRQSCFHEEIAQGLGLANDHPKARPSIFNDDEEFALLTSMDEILLRILYDQSLRPGMTLEQARPIVSAIATRLMGGES